ncbi:MAG: hypothetical protein ACE5H1_11165 [Thermodesulfobacteriota bacterium]
MKVNVELTIDNMYLIANALAIHSAKLQREKLEFEAQRARNLSKNFLQRAELEEEKARIKS